MLALALAALMFGVLVFGTALTHNADQLEEIKSLPKEPESMRAHDSIGAAAIVVIILVILALTR